MVPTVMRNLVSTNPANIFFPLRASYKLSIVLIFPFRIVGKFMPS